MKQMFIVNGKVTYPVGEENLTTFTFMNQETGDMFSMSTKDDEVATTINYGQRVTVEVLPLVEIE